MKKLSKKEIQKIIDREGCTDKKFNFNRRDFVRLGLLAGSGYLMPSLSPIKTFAQEASGLNIPFLVFDLNGGAGMPANFLVGKEGGPEDLFAKYEPHGWNPRASDSLDKTFGIPMSKKDSGMLRGLKETLPAGLINNGVSSNFKMTSICNFSLDDTDTNKSSALSLISKAGLIGEDLKSSLGHRSTQDGGNSIGVIEDPQYRPKIINSKRDVLNMIGLGDDFTQLDERIKAEIYNQLASHGDLSSPLRRGYEDLSLFGNYHSKGDPSTDPYLQDLYGIDESTQDGQNYIQAAIAYNVINGYSGPGVITIGDCDYHDPDRPDISEAKDLQIGRAVGRAINMAKHLNKPLFFQIITDGGVYSSSDSFDRAWIGDESLHSLTVMGYYDPNKEVEIHNLQLGHYTESGELQLETNVGNSPEDMVRAVTANYLNVNGQLGRFQELTGIRGLSADSIDALIGLG